MSEYTEQNNIVRNWKNKVLSSLKGNILSLVDYSSGKTGMVQRKGRSEEKLVDSLKGNVHTYYNQADGVTFKFERHGIFVHKGVGRGYSSKNNMVTKTSKNPEGHRDKIDWFNPILDKYTPELADKIGEINADAVVDAMKMKIR